MYFNLTIMRNTHAHAGAQNFHVNCSVLTLNDKP